jgi:hypothetical protein
MNIEEVFRKLRPVLGRQLDLLWQEYLVAETDTRQTIERTLRVLLAQRLNETFESEHVLLKPPPEDVARGEYPVGMIHYGQNGFYPFGLREEEFIQHIGIFGRSGSGKTNLAYLLLHGLTKAGKPFLVFDWKRNYRDLISSPTFADLVIFTVGRSVAPFRFNPLIPPPGMQRFVLCHRHDRPHFRSRTFYVVCSVGNLRYFGGPCRHTNYRHHFAYCSWSSDPFGYSP